MQMEDIQSQGHYRDSEMKVEEVKMGEKDKHPGQDGIPTEGANTSKSFQHEYFQGPGPEGGSLKGQDPEGLLPQDPSPKVEYFLGQPVQYDLEARDRLTLLTWNLDGLDSEELLKRAGGLFSNIKKYRPDVLLLQELVPEYLYVLKKHFVNYSFLQGHDEGYFTGIMLRKSRVELLHSDIIKYRTSSMARNLLMAHVNFFGRELCVMTSHLESCKDSSYERLIQLKKLWTRMREIPTNVTVIFGGDTNLRDYEVRKMGGLPEGIADVWEALGKPEDCRYTWDTTINDNKDIPNPIRLRFDRVFMRGAKDGPVVAPVSMELIGLEVLNCGYFTSDHWGILCGFSVGPEVTTEKNACKIRKRRRVKGDGVDSVVTNSQGHQAVKVKKVGKETTNTEETHEHPGPAAMPTQEEDTSKPLQVLQDLVLPGEGPRSQNPEGDSTQDPVPKVEYFLGQPVQCDLEERDQLTVLTWNLDGQDRKELLKRAGGLFCSIKKCRPDVIFLQELITPQLKFLNEHFKNYYIFTKHFCSQTCIMLRKSRLELLECKSITLPPADAEQIILKAHVNFYGHELYVMTSQLICGKQNSEERIDQLKKVWTKMKEAPDNVTAIFGGDTNLRDWEVKKVEDLSEGISDVWEALGKPEDCRYTWDCMTNDNKKHIPKAIRMRLDRVFLRVSRDGADVIPNNMALIGLKRLRCGLFTSDHWGVLCSFTVKPPDSSDKSTCERPTEDNVKVEEEKKVGNEIKEQKETHQSLQDQSKQDKKTIKPSKNGAGVVQSSLAKLFEEVIEDKNKLTVLCWSLDGLDKDAGKRCSGLFYNLDKYNPDIVLLQELVPGYLAILEEYFWNYELLQGSDETSFTCIMLKKYRVQLLHSDVVNYPTTEMRRNLLMANVTFYGRELCVMTSHLESGKENSQERMNQLRRVWKRMREAPDNVTVLFGGDTNLTDEEVTKLGGLPQCISDVWETLGKPEDCKYTWDATTNNNKHIPDPMKMRFDRIFLRPARDGASLTPESLALTGLERLQSGLFTSSHWGLLCGFTVGTQVNFNNNVGGQNITGNAELAGAEGGLTTEMPRVMVNTQHPEGQQKDRIKVEKEKVGEEMKKMEENQRLENKSSHKQEMGKPPLDDTPLEESTQGPAQPSRSLPDPEDAEDKIRLTLLTWNLDGQDEVLRPRTNGLLSSIKKHHPDVVLLQVLTASYLTELKEYFKDYEFLQGSKHTFFTCIMLKKYRVQLLHSDVVNYPTTEMRRNLLMANVTFYGRELCVMTSHLESGKENSQERMNQLRRVWKRMREAPDNVTVLFGGDTNLRDWEVSRLGGVPIGISDVWETLGKPEDCKYTWDTTTNDNKQIPASIRMRFDRIFLRPARDGASLTPESIALTGLERLQCGLFTSSHWGLLCGFTVDP